MHLSKSKLSEIKQYLQLDDDLPFQNYQRLGGGDINLAARFSLGEHSFFIKWNDARRYPGMFEAEAKGLAELAKADAVRIPKVKYVGEEDDQAFLMLELIEQGSKSDSYFRKLGEQLAGQHRVTQEAFGLDHDNYIGSLPQQNTLTDTWSEFFILHRLEAQLRIARNQKVADLTMTNAFSHLFAKLDRLFPIEEPALLHGDLWGGNQMADETNAPCIYDPAVYYGHREMDLAMTQLFGGFSPKFYSAYNDAFPLVEDWQERMDICNLYPLLVHLNLFGQSYSHQIWTVLRRFA